MTDANLVLGRLNPDRFLGGELKLDTAAARKAVQKIAQPLGYSGADGTDPHGGRHHLARHRHHGGRDQDRFRSSTAAIRANSCCSAMAAAGRCMRAHWRASFRSRPSSIPPEPGNFSAVGMLLADARLDVSKTFTGRLNDATVASLKDAFADMEEEARATLVRDFGAGEVLFERYGEMRYVGQRHNIKVPLPDTADPAAIRTSFDRDYKRRYGHADARANAEFQALHLSAFSRLRRPELKWLPRAQGGGCNAAAAAGLFRRRRHARHATSSIAPRCRRASRARARP